MPKLNFNHLSPTDFEEFTYHLLKQLKFTNVDWRKGTAQDSSPADSGRDIVCQRIREDVDKTTEIETWFVDCKHYKKGVPPADIQNLLTWAEAECPHTALIVTSGFLSNPAKDYLEKYKRNRKPHFRIKHWERPQLEQLAAAKRSLLLNYNLLTEAAQTAGTNDGFKARFVAKLNRIQEATAFGTSRTVLVDDIFVDVFFRPKFSLAMALNSKLIPNDTNREVLCSVKDYEAFISDPVVVLGPAKISDPWWTKALEFYAALMGDINQVLNQIDARFRESITTNRIDRLAFLAKHTPLLSINEAKLRLLSIAKPT